MKGPHQSSAPQLFAPPRAGLRQPSVLLSAVRPKPESFLLMPQPTSNPIDFRGGTTGIAYVLRKGHKTCILKIYLNFTIALLVVVSCRTPLIVLALNNMPNQNIFIYLIQMDELFFFSPPPCPGRKHFVVFPLFHLDRRALLISGRADEEHQPSGAPLAKEGREVFAALVRQTYPDVSHNF